MSVSTASRVQLVCIVRHGSTLYPLSGRAKCVICHLHNTRNFTQRKCSDCYLMPALCQTSERDCHSAWHSKSFSVIRQLWYEQEKCAASTEASTSTSTLASSVATTGHSRGRPKGSLNRSKRRGNYKARSRVGTPGNQ